MCFKIKPKDEQNQTTKKNPFRTSRFSECGDQHNNHPEKRGPGQAVPPSSTPIRIVVGKQLAQEQYHPDQTRNRHDADPFEALELLPGGNGFRRVAIVWQIRDVGERVPARFIRKDAESDAAKSGLRARIRITYLTG